MNVPLDSRLNCYTAVIPVAITTGYLGKGAPVTPAPLVSITLFFVRIGTDADGRDLYSWKCMSCAQAGIPDERCFVSTGVTAATKDNERWRADVESDIRRHSLVHADMLRWAKTIISKEE